MRKTTIITAALCASFLMAGCNKTAETSQSTSDTAATSAETSAVTSSDTSETETTPSVTGTSETNAPEHNITVEDQVSKTLSDQYGEYTNTIPKIIIDGKEAEEINASLKSYLEKTYPMDEDKKEKVVTGYRLRYTWGVKDNIISVIMIAGFVDEEGTLYEIFNYDADTLTALSGSEVVQRLGMTDKEFFDKTADAYKQYWDTEPWLGNEYKDLLEKSISVIGYDKVTPFITPNGDTGSAGYIYIPAQISEGVHCFDLDTLKAEYFS